MKDSRFEFDPERLVANRDWLWDRMGYCRVSVGEFCVVFRLPKLYSIALYKEGLVPFTNGARLEKELVYHKTLDDAFAPIQEALDAKLDELLEIPCLVSRVNER